MSLNKAPVLVAAMAFSVMSLITPAAFAANIDWSNIPTRLVTLFYPGQSSYQWLREKHHSKGYREVRRGDSCRSCHLEEEPELGESIVKSKRLGSKPVAGKPGSVDLWVQAAFDRDNAYLRFRWRTDEDAGSKASNYWIFDGKNWQSDRPAEFVPVSSEAKSQVVHQDRLALMIDDGSVPMFAAQGCWLTCHDGMTDMPHEANKRAVEDNELLGVNMHVDQVKKYLPGSRADKDASWFAGRTSDELNGLKASGGFVDLMQWRGNRNSSSGESEDGYILEYRHTDEEGQNLSSNWNDAGKHPQYMFDARITGFNTRSQSDLSTLADVPSLELGVNAVAFNPAMAWKAGDVLPKQVSSGVSNHGAGGRDQNVSSKWQDGMWTVVWSRKMNTGHPDDKVLRSGSAVTVGFALHDDNASKRNHYVSFPLLLGFGIDGQIDINALQITGQSQVIAQ